MAKRLNPALKSLTASLVVLLGCTEAVQARNGWSVVELVYNTADAGVAATEIFDGIGLAAAEPDVSVTRDDVLLLPIANKKQSGWRGVVDVEIKRAPSLDNDVLATFDAALSDIGQDRRMQAFYAMQYRFEKTADFTPYAGIGLGFVAAGAETEVSGTVAGRATAGFDLALAENTAIFAEYAFIKSGGVDLGGDDGGVAEQLPDSEHSLKLGFRRQF